MRWFLSLIMAWSLITPVWAEDVYVNGYYRRDGTYVQPHYRSRPDGDPTNNYSYPGNYNPHTGRTASSGFRSGQSSTRSRGSGRGFGYMGNVGDGIGGGSLFE